MYAVLSFVFLNSALFPQSRSEGLAGIVDASMTGCGNARQLRASSDKSPLEGRQDLRCLFFDHPANAAEPAWLRIAWYCAGEAHSTSLR